MGGGKGPNRRGALYCHLPVEAARGADDVDPRANWTAGHCAMRMVKAKRNAQRFRQANDEQSASVRAAWATPEDLWEIFQGA
jgi:hypothetical protein